MTSHFFLKLFAGFGSTNGREVPNEYQVKLRQSVACVNLDATSGRNFETFRNVSLVPMKTSGKSRAVDGNKADRLSSKLQSSQRILERRQSFHESCLGENISTSCLYIEYLLHFFIQEKTNEREYREATAKMTN